jgi:hypothetical protein
MLRYILLFTLIVGFTGCSSDDDNATNSVPSGPVVHQLDLLGPGICLTYALVFEPAAFNVDSAGPDRSWRFTDYDWDDTFTLTSCNPGECPFSTHFPDATRAVVTRLASEPGSDLSRFEKVDAHGIWTLGYADTGSYVVLATPDCQLELPFGYGTEWIEVEQHTAGSDGLTWLDSTIFVCDAWGTIVTPYDSCRALRGSELFVEYTWNDYEPLPQLDYADRNYYWFNEHGEIVAWVSAFENTANPYYDYGYINLRTYRETASAPASVRASGLERMQQTRAEQPHARHAAKSFSDIRYLR